MHKHTFSASSTLNMWQIARGSQEECDFALVINLSFYRFGIRSCLATNHKQTPKDAIQQDVIVHGRFLGNTTGQPPAKLFILCLLYVGDSPWRIAEYPSGKQQRAAKHNSGRFDKWLEILAVEDLTPKERRPELQREQRERILARSSSSLYKARG